MKELSIEEKAKAYDKAIEIINDYYQKVKFSSIRDFTQDEKIIEKAFPELAESEDEIVMRELIDFFGGTLNGEDVELPSKDTMERWVAWIEKQGEQKSLDDITKEVIKDKDTAISFLKSCGIMNENGELADEYKIEQGEQNLADKVEPKFKVGQTIKKEGFNLGFTIVKIEDGFYYNDEGDYFPFTDQDNWELVEQSPAWSEEDELRLDDIKTIIEESIFSKVVRDKNLDWLKSLKDRVTPQPKQEWSEEDEDTIKFLISHFCVSHHNRSFQFSSNKIITYDELLEKIRNLKPQSVWKPSDEQLFVLEFVADRIPDKQYETIVRELISDLKKL